VQGIPLVLQFLQGCSLVHLIFRRRHSLQEIGSTMVILLLCGELYGLDSLLVIVAGPRPFIWKAGQSVSQQQFTRVVRYLSAWRFERPFGLCFLVSLLSFNFETVEDAL
jgi:hypothetical protein